MLLLALTVGKIKIGSKQFKKLLDELYKEALELSMDYNCKVAIFVASKTDNSKIYSFRLPSVDSVVEAYLNNSIPVVSESDEFNMELCRKLYHQLKEMELQRKFEKKHGKKVKLKNKRRLSGGPKWWDKARMRKLHEDPIATLKSIQETSIEPSASAFSSSVASSSNAHEDNCVVEDDIVKHA